jgi:hypothetical protein
MVWREKEKLAKRPEDKAVTMTCDRKRRVFL